MHAIEELAAFVAGHRAGGLSGETCEAAALLVTDLMAATAAGRASGLARAAHAAAAGIYGPGAAGVWLTDARLSIAGAAMANAAAASALDIDDGHRGAAGHAGSGIIPAVLAVAEVWGTPDERIFDALALGYDIALRVATSRPTAAIETYSSGRWVNYGVAAAASWLLGLDATATAHAMAIAGAEGPISYPMRTSRYQGTTVKEVIPPAVVAGLTGAYRARGGATGPRDLLDDDTRFTRSVLTGGLGERWWLGDCYLKPYAACRYMHAAIDAILALRVPGKPIKRLRIETFPRGLGLANERAPTTLEGGQYSYYFSCALAALHGEAALQPMDPARLHDPEVLDLAGRIELVAHDDFASHFPERTPCRVIIDQGGGPQSRTVLDPLGDVANPMSRVQVEAKFRRLSAVTLTPTAQAVVLSALQGLTVSGFRPLFAALGSLPMRTRRESVKEACL